MNIIIVSPASETATLGNAVTARRWAGILRSLGHEASVALDWTGQPCDLLIALHARRSHSSVVRFRQAHAEAPLIAALTGTDLYADLPDSAEAQEALRLATRVVVLQQAALESLDAPIRSKTAVIYQSAAAPNAAMTPDSEFFDVCVLSHLRKVKDPLRAAWASRLLPEESKIRVIHAGRELEPDLARAARREQQENPRYFWLGDQPHDDAVQWLARSRAFVLSSLMEGGANAIAEAIVCGVPVLCSAIPGNVGMLGPNYSGYFRAEDSAELAALLHRAETDEGFLNRLRHAAEDLKGRFAPEQELKRWRELLEFLF